MSNTEVIVISPPDTVNFVIYGSDILFCNITVNTELMNTEPLFPREI